MMAGSGQRSFQTTTLVSGLAEELLGMYVCSDFELTSRAAPKPYFVSPNISGTYNNQYMVLDLKKVKPKYSLDTGTLYIVEQIPTYVEYSDQTEILRKGTVFMLEVWKSDPSVSVYAFVVGNVWYGALWWGGVYIGEEEMGKPLLVTLGKNSQLQHNMWNLHPRLLHDIV